MHNRMTCTSLLRQDIHKFLCNLLVSYIFGRNGVYLPYKLNLQSEKVQPLNTTRINTQKRSVSGLTWDLPLPKFSRTHPAHNFRSGLAHKLLPIKAVTTAIYKRYAMGDSAIGNQKVLLLQVVWVLSKEGVGKSKLDK